MSQLSRHTLHSGLISLPIWNTATIGLFPYSSILAHACLTPSSCRETQHTPLTSDNNSPVLPVTTTARRGPFRQPEPRINSGCNASYIASTISCQPRCSTSSQGRKEVLSSRGEPFTIYSLFHPLKAASIGSRTYRTCTTKVTQGRESAKQEASSTKQSERNTRVEANCSFQKRQSTSKTPSSKGSKGPATGKGAEEDSRRKRCA